MLNFGTNAEITIFLIDFGLSQLTEEMLPKIKNSKSVGVLANPSKTAIKGTDTLVDP
jgi:hypothetical protein